MEFKNNGGFSYTYSAKEQTEIRKIREKYTEKTPKEENKMERVRRLDARVTQKAQTVSLTVGVIGTLVLGFGMSLLMSDLGGLLGLPQEPLLPLGIGIGILGGLLVGFAYPLYQAVAKRERTRIAPEILRLTEELMK